MGDGQVFGQGEQAASGRRVYRGQRQGPRGPHPLLLLALLSACALGATPALAAPPQAPVQEAHGPQAIGAPVGPSIGAAIARALAPNTPKPLESMAIMAGQGATLGPLLVVEVLGEGTHVLAEVALIVHGQALRWPVKLARHPDPHGAPDAHTWEVTWTPAPVYAEALLALVQDPTLASLPPELLAESLVSRWTERPRLPALPVIATAERLVTPLGIVLLESPLGGHGPAGGRQEASSDPGKLAAPRTLVLQVQRWVREILADDAAPAHLEILADARLSWDVVTRILLGAVSAGLYKVDLVARLDSGEAGADAPDPWVSVAAMAPVMGPQASARGIHWLLVGMYPGADPKSGAAGFRVVQDGQFLPGGPRACRPDLSLCAPTAQELSAELKRLLASQTPQASAAPPATTHVMFATTGQVAISEVLEHLARLPTLAQVPAGRLVLGYIQP